MSCAKPPVVVSNPTIIEVRSPVMTPCKRITEAEDNPASNGELWSLKNRAIALLDKCADQVDAQIKNQEGK